MRILWCSNAPWVPTGYGVQTRLFVPRLQRLGHEVAVFALYGLEGSRITWNNIVCLPRGAPGVGNDIIGAHSAYWRADFTITLIDAWVYDSASFRSQGIRWLPWFPIDTEPVSPVLFNRVREASAQIVMSRFGDAECRQAGVTPYYIPHGIDTAVFVPSPRRCARKALGLPDDAYVVTMVAANKDWPSRKGLPQALEAFARFSSKHADAILYLHTTRGDEPWVPHTGINLPALVEHLGLTKRVLICNSYDLHLGLPDEHMVRVYGASDCLLVPSLGEGFGVPILEAQACGCPVIVGDWTSMPELCFAGYRIPRDHSDPFWTPLNANFRIPSVAGILTGLEQLYSRRHDSSLSTAARAGAIEYDADRVAERFWKPTLDALAVRLGHGEFSRPDMRLALDLLPGAPRGPIAEVSDHLASATADSATCYLAAWARDHGEDFESLGRDPHSIALANEYLASRGLPECARSAVHVSALSNGPPLAFLMLTGRDQPTNLFNQFLAAPLLPGAIVVVTDIVPDSHGPAGTASLLFKYLSGCAVTTQLLQAGTSSVLVCRVTTAKPSMAYLAPSVP